MRKINEAKRNPETECWTCVHRMSLPGSNGRIRCLQPDSQMTGDPIAMRGKGFLYPLVFDPLFKTRLCRNYEEEDATDGFNEANDHRSAR
jgi:hypothetical protein